MNNIHPTAIIDKSVELGDNVTVGPFTIIEENVKIGNNCTINSNVLIGKRTTLGEGCNIHHGAVVGSAPQDLKYAEEETFLTVGNNTTIREYATLNRATTHSYYTRVGDNCLLLAYSHVAHDCNVGNNVILSNSVNLAGHVTVEDYVGIGGLTPVHQFVKIGAHSFIGGGLRIPKDVPPFILAMGEPLKFAGLNKVGLQRRGFSEETIKALKEAYKVLYKSGLTVNEAKKELESRYSGNNDVQHLIDFLNTADRGIIR